MLNMNVKKILGRELISLYLSFYVVMYNMDGGQRSPKGLSEF